MNYKEIFICFIIIILIINKLDDHLYFQNVKLIYLYTIRTYNLQLIFTAEVKKITIPISIYGAITRTIKSSLKHT